MLSREKRKIYKRKIKGFWLDFSHNKVGIAGIILLGIFVIMAAFAPVIAPMDPINQKKVAAKYAVPDWITIFLPQYRSKPPTLHFPFNVTVASENQTCSTISVDYPQGLMFKIKYKNNGTLTNQTYVFESKFNYTYDEAPDWTLKINWKANFTGLNYRFEIYFRSSNGSEWIIWGKDYDIVTERVKVLQQAWNKTNGEVLVGLGSTDLKRRLYYEKYYEPLLEYYLKMYPFVNVTFQPEFVTFTYEGFKNETSLNSTDNPIYNTYLTLKQNGETNATWTEYWNNWINSTDAEEMWNLVSTYVNETGSVNTLYRIWCKGGAMPWTAPDYKKWRDYFSWEELYTIFNLTRITVMDDEEAFKKAMNSTDSPAYQRWVTLWNGTDLTWDIYLPAWIHIQYWFGRNWFINHYVQPLRLGPELAEKHAKKEAYNLAATSPAPTYFLAHKGTQTLRLYLFIVPKTPDATLTLNFSPSSEFIVWGARYGLLGTTSFGFDVWTQLVHGARISLIVGTLAAVLSTVLGILFGVTSGYLGGIVDEITMRIVDILLCLPLLPLLLALSSTFKPNVYYLVILIAIFGWQGLARVIRSQVLSLREMPFIESARASGASSSYLIIRHLIPNVFPIAMASMVLAVPAAILTEAALSFLGFGDPFAPTWGKMLHEAQSEGAFGQLAWWYIMPPGFAITFLCVAFVFIGHALDEIVNPRLRRRR